MIIVDTREQKPLWNPEQFNVVRKKLDEGDYTTENLYNKAHIERKSGADLYGSIIQGHKRFKAEIQRAIDKGLKFSIFVECPEETFYRKRFHGGFRCGASSVVLRKIIATMTEKYSLDFVWCEDRDDLRDRMCLWFVNAESEYGKCEVEIKEVHSEEMQKKRKIMVKSNEEDKN